MCPISPGQSGLLIWNRVGVADFCYCPKMGNLGSHAFFLICFLKGMFQNQSGPVLWVFKIKISALVFENKISATSTLGLILPYMQLCLKDHRPDHFAMCKVPIQGPQRGVPDISNAFF